MDEMMDGLTDRITDARAGADFDGTQKRLEANFGL
jgi:hypothetical protein